MFKKALQSLFHLHFKVHKDRDRKLTLLDKFLIGALRNDLEKIALSRESAFVVSSNKLGALTFLSNPFLLFTTISLV